MYRVEAVVFDKSDGGRTDPTGGLNYCEQCGSEVTN